MVFRPRIRRPSARGSEGVPPAVPRAGAPRALASVPRPTQPLSPSRVNQGMSHTPTPRHPRSPRSQASPGGPHRPPRLHRLLLGSAASFATLAGLVAAPSAAYADGLPAAPAPYLAGDRLVVTVRDAGDRADGTFELRCHPDGGSHPDARGACGNLDRSTTWGRGPFAPVASDSMCTMQYGGPATAHVTGTWAGRPVDAHFNRRNGCEIARWDSLVPLLPGFEG